MLGLGLRECSTGRAARHVPRIDRDPTPVLAVGVPASPDVHRRAGNSRSNHDCGCQNDSYCRTTCGCSHLLDSNLCCDPGEWAASASGSTLTSGTPTIAFVAGRRVSLYAAAQQLRPAADPAPSMPARASSAPAVRPAAGFLHTRPGRAHARPGTRVPRADRTRPRPCPKATVGTRDTFETVGSHMRPSHRKAPTSGTF